MGTSTNYGGSANWGPTRTDTTTAGGGGPVSPEKASEILSGIVDQMDTAPQLGFGPPLAPPVGSTVVPTPTVSTHASTSGASGTGAGARGSGAGAGRGGGAGGGGGGRGGGGGSRRVSGSARTVARGIGSFLSDVATKGFAAALAERGLTDLNGKSPDEVALALADVLGGPSSLIEETALRDALMALVLDWSLEAQNLDGLAQAAGAAAQNIEQALHSFFGHYIFEVFKTVGYQNVLETHGFEKAESMTSTIRDFIDAKVANVESTQSLASIDWNGPAGAAIVDKIVGDTRSVFGEAE
jgi:hypothetical protein